MDYSCKINQVCEGATHTEMLNYYFCRRADIDTRDLSQTFDAVNMRQQNLVWETQDRQGSPGTLHNKLSILDASDGFSVLIQIPSCYFEQNVGRQWEYFRFLPTII